MTNQNIETQQGTIADDEIDLKELFLALWQGKWIIIGTTLVAAVIAVVYALSLPNIYKSEALLAPAEDNQSGGLSGLAGQFGGLASLAGVNLGSGTADKTTIALELLKSRSFIGEFVKEHNLKPVIMAANGWDQANDRVIYDPEVYDSEKGLWVREVKAPKLPEPSQLEVHDKFTTQFLNVSKDKETGLVTISVKHYSPVVAKELTDKLIEQLNNTMRANDIADADNSIEYLSKALKETSVADMQKVFYQLIEQQQQTKMLASVRNEYALKMIDPAVVNERKYEPKRALICTFGVLLGALLSFLLVFLRSCILKINVKI
ncbi:Wzz/FepE/Etk N-terminal domain-containing protein [Pseudoalteromonas sp. BDTF-M6]|uniref:Wzz/FepE/Etk N-terminal domain-containing protein n=1 Tax=Pseudoalteromonas sp. BDTF-M6 TaxID=2796132 RepID=UPI001BB06AE9|nr:Wzz/FepE/Etk N-terminal domain-containing protein [Pseudoalteromonas sp. BDTF-M6]MBS3798483.1 LPS O-antigen length regulator [Pseudoalteromonas sp. BDTF-M6]